MLSDQVLRQELHRIMASNTELDAKTEMVESLAHSLERHGGRNVVIRNMVQQNEESRQALEAAKKALDENEKLMEKILDPPHFPATFFGFMETERGPRAEVRYNHQRTFVSVTDTVDLNALAVGDEVLLNSQNNILMCPSPWPSPRHGETAIFEGLTPDGLLVLNWRDEKPVFIPVESMAIDELRRGDRVRIDRNLGLAYEKIDFGKDKGHFLEETPSNTFDQLGGLENIISALKESVDFFMENQDVADDFQAQPVRGIILEGPTGNGKTCLARCLANYAAKQSKSNRSYFMHKRPGEDHSMWFGQSEQNVRETFRAAREASLKNPDVPVILFYDEVESIGMARGSTLSRINDHIIQAFMAELDGLQARGNVLVIAATNRADALDPALIREGRLGDEILKVPRPNLRAAREIFSLYLPENLPYASPNAEEGREEIIEASLSAIYSPNGESTIANLHFRDQNQYTVKRSHLINGAMIRKVTNVAKKRAARRFIKTGRRGIEVQDVLTAISEEFSTLGQILTPANCRKHLTELPLDSDVVSVARVDRRVPLPHRYLTLSVA